MFADVSSLTGLLMTKTVKFHSAFAVKGQFSAIETEGLKNLNNPAKI